MSALPPMQIKSLMPDSCIVDGLKTISAEQWNKLEFNNNPFLSYSFLSGLEKYNCLANQYWQPHHVVIKTQNQLLGFMPLYIKKDSYGEFVFDWAWADAYHRVGKYYYPKLVSAVPFTPVSGARLLVNKDCDRTMIKNKLIKTALSCIRDEGFSSLHILFPEKKDLEFMLETDGLKRITCQYHWFNNGYRDFKDFTDSLTSKKRKRILKERREIEKSGIEIQRLNGNEISVAQWEAFYEFYCATFYKKWGAPRLTLDFFKSIGKSLPEQTILILAKQQGDYIAGAFSMNDDSTIYGRHWGCKAEVPFLHFELCYYQTIEHAILNGFKKLDVGVQGEHKLARGFHPVAMPSSHWIKDDDFRLAIENYLTRETAMMSEYIAEQTNHLPFRVVAQ